MLLNTADWKTIKSLDYPMKYWFTCFLLAVASGAKEIYFYEEAGRWFTSTRCGDEYFQLVEAPAEFYEELKRCLVSLFVLDALHSYISSDSHGHFALIIGNRVVNSFLWFESDDNFAINLVYDDAVPGSACDVIARHKDGV